jgi:hypothetical protein
VSTFLFVNAPVAVLESLAGVPAGTDAAIKAASDAFHAVAVTRGRCDAEDGAFLAMESAIAQADPTAAYHPIGPYGQGLGRFLATPDFLKGHNLEYVMGDTQDAQLVRKLLAIQRARPGWRNVLGADAHEIAEMNRTYEATIDRLIAALDRGVSFGLCWS